MKKMLVLLAVLGLVSTANATLSLSINGNTDISSITLYPSDYVTVDIHSDDILDWLAYLDLTDNDLIATRVSAGFTANAGPDSSYSEYSYYGYWEYEVSNTDFAGGSTQPGSQFEVVLHCEGLGNVEVLLYDDQVNLIDTATIVQLPEPMTIALLGLGGLFLRRRK